MKALIALFFFLAIILTVFLNNSMTGNIVIKEDNPCRIVHCNVQLFGFIKQEPEWIGTTPNGYAVCHCPQESMDWLFYVYLGRKY